MKEFIDKTMAFVKANILISVLIGIAIIFLFFGRQVKRLLFGTRRVKHRRVTSAPYVRRRRSLPRRSLPRSVGMHKVRRKIDYNKNGTRKKPWQIKGSPAARRHMAQIRSRR